MDYYETIGVSRNSEPEVIEAAYRALMKKYHPDRWPGDAAVAEPRAKLINEAFATLRDPERRRAYDKLNPPQAHRTTKKRKPLKPAAKARERHPVRHRVRVQPAAQSRRANGRDLLANDAAVPAMTIVACLAMMALITLASRGPSEAQLTAIGPVAMPRAEAAFLSGGRKQTACITNKTSKPVNYTLYWGGTGGRQYTLDHGYSMIHSSSFRTAPVIEFFDNDGGEPARQVIKSAITTGRPTCEPNNSFQYKALDGTNWSGEERFGLYRDEQAEAPAAAPSFVESMRDARPPS